MTEMQNMTEVSGQAPSNTQLVAQSSEETEEITELDEEEKAEPDQ